MFSTPITCSVGFRKRLYMTTPSAASNAAATTTPMVAGKLLLPPPPPPPPRLLVVFVLASGTAVVVTVVLSQAPHMIVHILCTPLSSEMLHAVAEIDTPHSLASMQLRVKGQRAKGKGQRTKLETNLGLKLKNPEDKKERIFSLLPVGDPY